MPSSCGTSDNNVYDIAHKNLFRQKGLAEILKIFLEPRNDIGKNLCTWNKITCIPSSCNLIETNDTNMEIRMWLKVFILIKKDSLKTIFTI